MRFVGTARSIVGGSTNGGNTGIVDEGDGVAETVPDGEGEADGVPVGVAVGVGDGSAEGVEETVPAAKTEGDGATKRSGRVNISPVSINLCRSTGHCYIFKA